MDNEQPMPRPNSRHAIVGVAKDLLDSRDATGRERYGTSLQPFNGRNFGRDADEEIADFFLYFVGLRIEQAERIRELLRLIGEQGEKIKLLEKELIAVRAVTVSNHE
jgi:hypothetical protein